ncbi:hypothetical protein [Desnuesiella massiliensis]|uniref:hypothetical protein n=1 Tax=Desnuesiella massiliensis TaxID=1650662 RepID=UPI0006E25F6D|nr:hypothetical protein [Desnuesiella massiliensis]
MNNYVETSKKAEITMKLSHFEMPPMQDALIVGKRAPIGPEGARRMVNIISPDQYEVIKISHEFIEGIIIRKSLLSILPKDKLISIILEEGERIANETTIIKVEINLTVKVSRSIDI